MLTQLILLTKQFVLVTENRSVMVFDVPVLRQIITELLQHTAKAAT
jgi:hypothetical protein